MLVRYGHRWSERLPVADRPMLETRYRLLRRVASAVVLFLAVGALLFSIPATRGYAQAVFASSAVLGLLGGVFAPAARAPLLGGGGGGVPPPPRPGAPGPRGGAGGRGGGDGAPRPPPAP